MATSELLQHELDHLDGVLSIDRAINSSKAKEQDIDVSQMWSLQEQAYTLSLPGGIRCCSIFICLTWVLTAFLSRISSFSALISSISSILWVWIFGMPDAIFVMFILTVLIWWRHTENIKRIINNTEPKINN